MAIYTKTGDTGVTALATGERVMKNDPRVEAYGTIDELSSFIGLLEVSLPAEPIQVKEEEKAVNEQLYWIQDRLFNVCAVLSEAKTEHVRIKPENVEQLEIWIDQYQEVIPKRFSFIFPADNESVCRAHVCRTVCRRAERRMLDIESDALCLQFVNRLSDYFYILARYLGHKIGIPGTCWTGNV